MNNTQRALLVIYLPITLLILILDNVYPGANMVRAALPSTSIFIVVFLYLMKYVKTPMSD